MRKTLAITLLTNIMVGNFLFSSLDLSDNINNNTNESTAIVEKQTFRVVLAPRDIAVLSSRVHSVVNSISKRMGQSFDKNEVLVQMDDSIYKAEKKRSEAILEKGLAKLRAQEELFSDNVASTFELKEAQAEVATAEAELATAELNLQACRIKAPYTGRIVRIIIHEHEIVQPGQELVEVVDDKVLLAKLLIPSTYFNQLSLGQELLIHVSETGVDVPAYVSHIGSVIDPASSMIQIYAEVKNDNGELRAGMIGTTELDKQHTNDDQLTDTDYSIDSYLQEQNLTEETQAWEDTQLELRTY
jgi:membrane fusion protein (multidrug efflux system)